ncbi:AlbA family DNA-binding domain-containing protein, partial [Bacillus tropicus]|uniref:AlbA family DNA-binding domain-containing protein n=1 Tax=Bacillus tropicus TaxID=2026188 RepID=UPI003EDA7CD6
VNHFPKLRFQDFFNLITYPIIEGTTIEYKENVDLKSASGKKEFARDVTSFANTIGGDMIIGVKEDEGVVTSVPGMKIDMSLDDYAQAIENTLRDTIEPQLSSLEMPVSSA